MTHWVNESAPFDALCLVSHQIVSSPTFLICLAATTVLDCISLLGNAALVVSLARLPTLHVNFRMLAINMSVCSAVISVYHLVRVALTLSLRLSDKCEFVTSALGCLGQEIILGLCEGTVVSSMVCITIERWYSSRSHSWYEHSGVKFGCLLLALSWLESCLGVPLFFGLETHQPQVPYCLSIFIYNTYAILVIVGIDLIVCTIATASYLRMYSNSRRMLEDFSHRQSHFSLTSRVTFRRTAEITRGFLPSAVTHGLVWAVCGIGSILLVCDLIDLPLADQFTLGYFVQYTTMSTFSAAHPILVLWKSVRIREALKTVLRHICGQLNIVQPNDTDGHLDSVSVTAVVNHNQLNVNLKTPDPAAAELQTHFQEMRDLWGYQTQFA